jgi:hypothetical protein
VLIEVTEQQRRVGQLEVVLRLLDLVLVIDIALGHATQRAVGPQNVVHALDALQIHRKPLQPVRDLAHDRTAVEPADLLEVRELVISMPFSQISQPRPQAPSVGDSQLSSTRPDVVRQRIQPSAASEPRYRSMMFSGEGLMTT